MKANYTIDAGDIKVIRPLIYVRERATRDFSQQSGLPIINENCPACFEQPKVVLNLLPNRFMLIVLFRKERE
jgi:tRNA(Ile)-lysidine synthase TilS/MesJ